MEPLAMMQTLRDPAGIPFYAVIFQFLLVLTFSLHIIFVNTTVGSAFLAFWGGLQRSDFWKRLASGSARAATVSTSLAILFGIAPLLFVQVLYDSAWYTSNLLSAAWVIGFLFIMIAAYSSMYRALFLAEEPGNGSGMIWALVAFTLYLLAGVIMHALQFQTLFPEKWVAWATMEKTMATSGTALHAFDLPRFLHFLLPAPAMTGIMLMLYAWYRKDDEGETDAFPRQCGELGSRLAFFFTLLQMIAGFWWLLTLQPNLAFTFHPLVIAGILLTFPFFYFLYKAMKEPSEYAIPSAVLAFILVFVMAATREVLRMKYLGIHGYSIFDYPVHVDWGSTVFFLTTFVTGLVIIGYQVATVYLAGKAKATYEASPVMATWGRASIGLLVTWLVVVVALGVVISFRNFS